MRSWPSALLKLKFMKIQLDYFVPDGWRQMRKNPDRLWIIKNYICQKPNISQIWIKFWHNHIFSFPAAINTSLNLIKFT